MAAVFMSRRSNIRGDTGCKTAVSEAVTNAIIHGYGKEAGEIFMDMTADPAEKNADCLHNRYRSRNCGCKKTMEPLYTTDTTGERSGMGFFLYGSLHG